MIREEFLKCLGKHELVVQKQILLWSEIEKKYADAGRHYHTLQHLDNLLAELLPYQKLFENWDAVVFAIAFHDVIYNVLKSDNEEKSAMYAVQKLNSSHVPSFTIDRCESFILATKKHEKADDQTNLFTDADLSVLGSNPEVYRLYAEQIRREYNIYPDFMYRPGRRKVLQHFLAMERIFKSDEFYGRYESQARSNLSEELERLN
jgi:predicted metal-dependent HD superfamily phosphohydrolase